MSEYKCGVCLDSGFMSKFEVCDNCNTAHKIYEEYERNNQETKPITHNITITLTSQEMRSLSDRAAKHGYLPVAYLKHLATQNETVYFKAENSFNVHKPNKDGNCINCTDPWETVKYPCKYAESDSNE